jgi:hypothetical protein
VTDQISVTPALFDLNNPGGNEGGQDQSGVQVKTSCRF